MYFKVFAEIEVVSYCELFYLTVGHPQKDKETVTLGTPKVIIVQRSLNNNHLGGRYLKGASQK
jgi:hypothetical protein